MTETREQMIRRLTVTPPHGWSPKLGRCDCDDCNLYHRWVDVAEQLTWRTYLRGNQRKGEGRYNT